jgi:hypothetical protein
MADDAMRGATAGAGAPVPSICAACGAANVPDRAFVFGAMALVPHANQLLVSVRCLTCGTDYDIAIWTIDRQGFISEVGVEILEAATKIEAVGLLARYHSLVERYRHEIGGWYECPETRTERDRFMVSAKFALNWVDPVLTAVPMAVLAVCRGIRQTVAARPGAQPPLALRLGHYRCAVSFDETPARPYPYALHVSVGNDAVSGHLPRLEQLWLLSLFFTPGELPLLETEPEQTVPVIHFYLPAYSPALNPC